MSSLAPHPKLYEFVEEPELQGRSSFTAPSPITLPSSPRSAVGNITIAFSTSHSRWAVAGRYERAGLVLLGFQYRLSSHQLNGFGHTPQLLVGLSYLLCYMKIITASPSEDDD